jgi:type IV pilus assembly protein PilW
MNAITRAQGQKGETLVGLMVGMGLGLVVLAGGAHLLGQHFKAHRWALQDSHVHQDLRSALDNMARELRQAQGVGMAWKTRTATRCTDDFCADLGDLVVQGQRIDFARDRNQNGQRDNNECSGFRLKDHELQIRTACTPEVWTDLTDAGSLKLSALSWQVHCERRGPWLARSVTVQLSAQWPRDPTKTLSLSQTIALRNEVPAQPWPAICGAPA